MTKVMKNSLFALLLALGFVPAFAQKTLPLSVQSHAADLNPQIVSMLQRAGFELPDQQGPSVQSRSNDLQLDSTKTFFGYDLSVNGDSAVQYRSIYQYPQPNVTVETAYQIENDAWRIINRLTTTSDNQNRIVEVYAETYDQDNQEYVPDSKMLAFPHGNSAILQDSFFVYQWDLSSNAWTLLFFGTNAYDDQDRLVESISSFDYFGTVVLFKDVYTYDPGGDKASVASFAIFNGEETPAGRREMTFKNQLLVEELGFVPDGLGGYLPQSKTTYVYTPFNQQEHVNTYEWNFETNDWMAVQLVNTEYDNAQRVKSQEHIYFNQDGLETRELVRTDYVVDEHLASESNYVWDGDVYYLSDRKHYYYSGGTLAAPETGSPVTPLVVSPNPSTGLIRLNLDEASMVQIYNAQGELVSSSQCAPNQSLNLSELPSGLYFVTADAGKERFSGRLVKE